MSAPYTCHHGSGIAMTDYGTVTCQSCGGDYFTGPRYHNRGLCEDCLWDSRPRDYVWNGKRVTHYLNHGSTWQSAPATEQDHWTLAVFRSPTWVRCDRCGGCGGSFGAFYAENSCTPCEGRGALLAEGSEP